jgi:hypothetical protein
MTRSQRQLEIDVCATAEKAVENIGVIGELILTPTPENVELLLSLKDFLATEIDPALAMTDSARFLKLSRLRAELTVRGFRHFFET